MKLHKVSDKVYANWDGETGGNVGVIELSKTALAVDAQYPGSAKQFREAIPRATHKPLTHLLLTHVHGDHIFGNMVFKDLEIVSQTRLYEKMEENLKNEWAPGNLETMLETYKRDAPERWWLFEGLEIVLPQSHSKTSGHTKASNLYTCPDTPTVAASSTYQTTRHCLQATCSSLTGSRGQVTPQQIQTSGSSHSNECWTWISRTLSPGMDPSVTLKKSRNSLSG